MKILKSSRKICDYFLNSKYSKLYIDTRYIYLLSFIYRYSLYGGYMFPLSEPTYLILLALSHQSMHGYGIIKTIEDASEQAYIIAPGTLYGVLKNLEKQKAVEITGIDLNNRKKKMYAITTKGMAILQEEQTRYEKLLNFTYHLKTIKNED